VPPFPLCCIPAGLKFQAIYFPFACIHRKTLNELKIPKRIKSTTLLAPVHRTTLSGEAVMTVVIEVSTRESAL
jgi:hypothetical protein